MNNSLLIFHITLGMYSILLYFYYYFCTWPTKGHWVNQMKTGVTLDVEEINPFIVKWFSWNNWRYTVCHFMFWFTYFDTSQTPTHTHTNILTTVLMFFYPKFEHRIAKSYSNNLKLNLSYSIFQDVNTWLVFRLWAARGHNNLDLSDNDL